MAFLKFIFWILIAGFVILLWKDSPRVDLPIGGQYDVNARLMTFILLGFALGFVPLYVWQRAARWRMGRRVKSMEIELAELRRRAYPPIAPALPDTPAPIVEDGL